MILRAAALSAVLCLSGAAQAQAQAADAYPKRLPAPGGEVLIPSEKLQPAYDQYKYAPARRVGDMLYVSGAIIGPPPGRSDAEGFKTGAVNAFKTIEASLKAAGASWDDVVMINSFHVWDGPNFTGSRMDQISLMNEVRAQFTTAPHPAWTAVGTTGLLAPNGVVEVQVIAKIPAKP
jgi:enamine deaminase RidA (YjgF/YER057c/UK114 family)